MKLVWLAPIFFMICCTKPKHEPGVCLSFDDRFIKQWYEQRELFSRYNVKATFYVTQFDSLSPNEIEMLHQLQNDGHEIASHGALHIQAESYIKQYSYQNYTANEIDPGISAMKKAGFDPVSFAYPYGSKYWFTDFLLLRKFKSTRGVAVVKNKTLTQVDKAYYGFDKNRKLFSLELDGNTTIHLKELARAFDRAVEKHEVILLSAHEPSSEFSPGPYKVNILYLDSIFKEAKSRQLRFYLTRDLFQ